MLFYGFEVKNFNVDKNLLNELKEDNRALRETIQNLQNEILVILEFEIGNNIFN